MPLNNQKLDAQCFSSLREIPLDDDAKFENYQTKVSIYDAQCMGCGFVRASVTMPNNQKLITDDLDKAISLAVRRSGKLERSCSYPSDVYDKFGKPVFPSLSEIVSNTCAFWNINRLNIPKDIETEFVEVAIEEMEEVKIGSKDTATIRQAH